MGTSDRRHRQDLAHHHPRVRQGPRHGWGWECSCGGASSRAGAALTWHEAVVGALHHSATIAP
jgi:hypothetical protein